MIYGIVLCLCVLWHVVLPQSHLEWPSCSGGSSLLGLDEWKDKSQRCCELSGVCHGYDSGSVATEVVGSLQNLLNATLPIQKSRIKRDFGFGDGTLQPEKSSVVIHAEETALPASPCCQSKISVFYPITGFSAISRKRVAIIQIAPFKQPVVYERCLERGCRILRGHCTQVYSPQPLYILTTDEGGKLAAKLDFILVEAGCQCQTRPLGDDAPSGSMGVDSAVPAALRIITGADFDDDYFAMLADLDAAAAIAGLDQPITRPKQVLTTSTSTASIFAASNPTPVIDHDDAQQEEVGNPATVTPSTNSLSSSVQTLAITSSSPPLTESSHDLGSNVITSPPPPTTATTPATTAMTTTTAATTLAATTTTTTTVLPLPELPENGQPILIPAGYFDPVLSSISQFLR